MAQVAFLLNGNPVRLKNIAPTVTLLDWLRDERGLTGTKEGCNEGDCGACTVMVSDARGSLAMNSCILLLPQLHGKAIRTVEGMAGPNGEMHPVQDAMVQYHGSQCGFCTPGFIVAMAVAHKNRARDFDDQLAGNLCRCTGYAPIIRAAKAAAIEPVPDWMHDDLSLLGSVDFDNEDMAMPQSSDELANWCAANPDGLLVGGATDVGLWVTKQLDTLTNVAFLAAVEDLQEIEVTEDEIRVGACVTVSEFMVVIAKHHPDFAEMVRRFGAVQVRNAGTVGGNIANGSPIGDCPPALRGQAAPAESRLAGKAAAQHLSGYHHLR